MIAVTTARLSLRRLQATDTEGACASLRYGFEHLRLERVVAAALVDNRASQGELEKIGLWYENLFTASLLLAIASRVRTTG